MVRVEQSAAQGQFLGAMAVRHESVVADALESVGQYVHEEAADEFVGIQAHGLVGQARLVVLVGEGDCAVLDRHEAMVGNRRHYSICRSFAQSRDVCLRGARSVQAC